MNYEELVTMVEQGMAHARAQGDTPVVVCMNRAMGESVKGDTILGLKIKIIDVLADGKVILE